MSIFAGMRCHTKSSLPGVPSVPSLCSWCAECVPSVCRVVIKCYTNPIFSSCYKAADELDDHNWSGLGHAIDASVWSWRAMKCAKILAGMTPPEVINAQTIGELHWPDGYTCLHLCCDASDKSFARVELAALLIDKNAEVNARTPGGNTPFLLAAGCGITDVVGVLESHGADIYAVNNNNANGNNKCQNNSSMMRKALGRLGVPQALSQAESGRTRTTFSDARAARVCRSDHHRGE